MISVHYHAPDALAFVHQVEAVCAKNSDSDVLMMKSHDQSARHDAPVLLNRSRDRGILVQ